MPPIPLATADKIAAKIAAELIPFCDQVEIAGSIRRRRPQVNDIDIVALPKSPAAEAAMRERCTRNAVRLQTDGKQTLIAYYPLRGLSSEALFELDLWIAEPDRRDLFSHTPTNFGTLLLCRTGSKQHNIYLIEHAKRLGLRWNPYHGVYDGAGHCLACVTEHEIFQALRLEFVPPEAREV